MATARSNPRVRWFVFIRAINTGGRRLTNDDLVRPFLDYGLHDVVAYQAAGNVTFTRPEAESIDVAELERTIAEAYGFEAPVFLRTRAELVHAVDAMPFTKAQLAPTERRVQVAFLADRPAKSAIESAMGLVPDEDTVAFVGREWYWLPIDGVSSSHLSVSAVERAVGPMTMRTLGTAERLLAKFA